MLSPDAIAINRIIISEAARFHNSARFLAPGQSAPRQIKTFLRRAVEAGTLVIADTKVAAEQFVALLRGDIHQRQLLRLDDKVDPAELAPPRTPRSTFLKAFGASSVPLPRPRAAGPRGPSRG